MNFVQTVTLLVLAPSPTMGSAAAAASTARSATTRVWTTIIQCLTGKVCHHPLIIIKWWTLSPGHPELFLTMKIMSSRPILDSSFSRHLWLKEPHAQLWDRKVLQGVGFFFLFCYLFFSFFFPTVLLVFPQRETTKVFFLIVFRNIMFYFCQALNSKCNRTGKWNVLFLSSHFFQAPLASNGAIQT